MHRATLDVADFLAEVADRWQAVAENRDLTIDLDLPDVGMVEADPLSSRACSTTSLTTHVATRPPVARWVCPVRHVSRPDGSSAYPTPARRSPWVCVVRSSSGFDAAIEPASAKPGVLVWGWRCVRQSRVSMVARCASTSRTARSPSSPSSFPERLTTSFQMFHVTFRLGADHEAEAFHEGAGR